MIISSIYSETGSLVAVKDIFNIIAAVQVKLTKPS